MSKCHHCGIIITDPSETCPLCKGVVEIGGDTRATYPDIPLLRKKLFLIRRGVLFACMVAAALCLYVDYHTADGFGWSIIAAAGILAGVTIFLLMTDPSTGYRTRTLFTIALSVAFILIVDYATGFKGWSVNFVIPGVIFLFNLSLLILMVINKRSWYSYLIYQILAIFAGAIPIILIYRHIVTFPILSELAFGASVFLFIGTLLFGGRMAVEELQRRFYIG